MAQDRLRKTAVDAEVLARHEAGQGTDHELDDVGDVFRLADPMERDQLFPLL